MEYRRPVAERMKYFDPYRTSYRFIAIFLCSILLLSVLLQPDVRAVEIMQPLVYRKGMEIAGWLMSEKLDGVRGYWDGRRLFSKNGMQLHPPPAFTENFPEFPVEGELWGGRLNYEKTAAAVLKKKAHDGWFDLQFAIFDVPGAKGGFEQRLRLAADWFAGHPSPYAFVIEHLPVRDADHLEQELERVVALGGEGLILRRPGSPYSTGRSEDILKVKTYSDMEARVLAHLEGKGRNSGRMGSLLVELPGSAIRFRIGTGFSDYDRQHPPPIGSLITFKHYGFFQSGIPRFPSFLRIRKDP